MSVDRQRVEATIRDLLGGYNKDGVELTPETDIAADLNIDSADVLNFVMEVEDAFDVDISLNELSDVRTIAQLVDLVVERIEA